MSTGGEVRYKFIASGQDDVLAAFKSINQAAEKSGGEVQRSYSRMGRAAKESAGVQWGAQSRPLNDLQKLAAKVAADQEREAQRASRAQEKAAQKTTQEAWKAAKEQARAAEYVYQIKKRYLEAQEREEEKAAQTAAKRRRENDSAMFGRGGIVHGAFSAAAGLALGVGAAAMGTVGAAARESVNLRDVSRRISIASRGAGEKFVSAGELQNDFEQTALAHRGQTAAGIAEGTALYVAKTGDLATARSNQNNFATVANATGSNYADISNTAADLAQKFDITGVQAMQQAFATLTFQGKKGAFELKDAAQYFSEMSAAAQRFGVGKGPEALKTLGGLAQIARTSAGSSAETATAVERMFSELLSKEKTVSSKYGVDVFRDGKTRAITDILPELISKAGGNDAAEKASDLQKIFGDRGIKAVSPLITAYQQTYAGTKGTDDERASAGIKAINKVLTDAINADGDWSEVMKDEAMAQQDSGAQLTAAWEQLKAKTSAELTPALINLVPKVTTLVGVMDPVIGVMIDLARVTADVLKFFGKFVGPEIQTKADATRKLKAFNEGIVNPMEMTHEQVEMRKKLRQDVEDADRRENPTAADLAPLTKEQFISKFVDSDHRHETPLWGGLDSETERAKRIWGSLHDDTDVERGAHEHASTREFADTDAQVSLITQTAEQITAEKDRPEGDKPPKLSVDELNEQLLAAAKAAETFKSSLGGLSRQGSITGGYEN